MNATEPSASSPTGAHTSKARDIDSSSSRSPTHVESDLSSSISSSRSRSSATSRKHSGAHQSPQSQKRLTESTPINGASSSRGYQATEPPNPTRGNYDSTRNDQITAPESSNAAGSSNQKPQTNQPEPEDEEPHRSWLGRLVDRFGALELENKGSVARDHLALGRITLSFLFLQFFIIYLGISSLTAATRTNIPSMDAHLSGICLNRHRRHPTIPIKQRHCVFKCQLSWLVQQSPRNSTPFRSCVHPRHLRNVPFAPGHIQTTQCRKTPRLNFYWRCYFNSNHRIPPLL